MKTSFLVLIVMLSLRVAAQEASVYAIDQPVRLSQWLLAHPELKTQDALSIEWLTPEQRVQQTLALEKLNQSLRNAWHNKTINTTQYESLQNLLQAFAVTGRVPLAAANSAWLEASPRRNPLLQPDDQLRTSPRSASVQVLNAMAQVCELPHVPSALAKDYVGVCQKNIPAWVWVVQPDGRVQRHGTDFWNLQLESSIAPGARIWAPEAQGLSDDVNLAIAQQLSAQGSRVLALPVVHQPAPVLPSDDWLDLSARRLTARQSSSDWGGVGLLQMSTARMQPSGYFGIGVQHAAPYNQVKLFAQPTQDLEVGFRYLSITDRLYSDVFSYSGTQSYLDKSLDVKLRVWHESTWLPDVALGMHDVGGTGLFSSEFAVVSKRLGRLDVSAGMNWGYLAQRGAMTNPLGLMFGHGFDSRVTAATSGALTPRAWFHGNAAPFIGASYETPWRTTVKVEYDTNNYQHEPLGNVLPSRSPINLGLVYHLTPWIDGHVSYERGNTLSVGMTFYTNLAGPSFPKIDDPVVPGVQMSRPSQEPNWEQTAKDLNAQTQWRIRQLYRDEQTIIVSAEDSSTNTPQTRLDKAFAVLHRDSPESIDQFEIRHHAANEDLAVQGVNRQSWVQSQTAPARTALESEPVVAPTYNPKPIQQDQALLQHGEDAVHFHTGLDLMQTFGGPNGFDIYQFSLYESMKLKLGQGFELNGLARYRLLSNYDNYQDQGSSELPRVRTYLQKYLTTSRTTLSSLSLSNTQRLQGDWFGSVYGGYLEDMFAGVGAEAMYRQSASRWAFGVDINQVRQRDFAQNFALLNPAYQATTGHFTTYWQTPLEGVTARLAVGQYLAGDRGATLTMTKTFRNGSVLGIFATKTNVSASAFGEGSFDKGLFWSFPFEHITTSTTNGNLTMAWHPLTRDGGAMLMRPVNLYNSTAWLAPDAAYRRAAPNDNDNVIPDDRREYHQIHY